MKYACTYSTMNISVIFFFRLFVKWNFLFFMPWHCVFTRASQYLARILLLPFFFHLFMSLNNNSIWNMNMNQSINHSIHIAKSHGYRLIRVLHLVKSKISKKNSFKWKWWARACDFMLEKIVSFFLANCTIKSINSMNRF